MFSSGTRICRRVNRPILIGSWRLGDYIPIRAVAKLKALSLLKVLTLGKLMLA